MQFTWLVSSFISAQFGVQNWTQSEVTTSATLSFSAWDEHIEIWKQSRALPQKPNIITSLIQALAGRKFFLFQSIKIKSALQIISKIIWLSKRHWHAKMHLFCWFYLYFHTPNPAIHTAMFGSRKHGTKLLGLEKVKIFFQVYRPKDDLAIIKINLIHISCEVDHYQPQS